MSIDPSTGAGSSRYTEQSSQQAQLQTAQKDKLNKTVEMMHVTIEGASSDGKFTREKVEECKVSLSEIANDPQMPRNYQDVAKNALAELDRSHGRETSVLSETARDFERLQNSFF